MGRLGSHMRSRRTAGLAARAAVRRLQGQTNSQCLYTRTDTSLTYLQAWDPLKVDEIMQFACASEKKRAGLGLHPAKHARCASAPIKEYGCFPTWGMPI